MLRTISIALMAAVAAFLVFVALQPASGTVTRSAVLAASPDVIFPHINSIKKWDAWSPWAKLDPNAKNTFEGPEAGVGSSMAWDGNNDIGTGKMSIIESDANKRVKYRLDFQKPMTSTSTAEFTLQPEAAGTRVTWTMTGERPFMARVICTVMGVDRMVGSMFEQGLVNLGNITKSS
jgi:uncharacterized protein YndB with AHSA1/START domain